MTIRRGVGGAGRGVSVGSGDGVRDREKRFEMLGRSCKDGIDRWCDGGVEGASDGGAGAKLITRADSARSACPTW